MKRAIIYTRVSTDEQAQKGYSLPHQEAMLRRHCEIHNIEVVKHYQEDHSAKDFNRPQFGQLLDYARKHRKEIDMLLFTRWDRFSRNSEAAYGMIRTFRDLGIEVCSQEQPLDMSIPDSKVILAMYLIVPEVENDKNSTRTKEGMRKAGKLGLYMGVAPKGYLNSRNVEKRSTLEYDPLAYPLVKEALETFASGLYSAEEVRKKFFARSGCIPVAKQTFYNMLRNPVYAGKIVVPAYKKEEAMIVEGIHPPIISMTTFHKNQFLLSGNKKVVIKEVREEFPLRRSLQCPTCNKLLTASLSKSRNGDRYGYYHCQKGCTYRQPAVKLNVHFEEFLSEFELKPKVYELYKEVFLDFIETMSAGKAHELQMIEKELQSIKIRKHTLDELLMDKRLDVNRYSELYNRCNFEIETLSNKRASLIGQSKESKEQLLHALLVHRDLTSLYREASVKGKREIIGSIFPEKLVFENEKYRTSSAGILASLIFQNNSELENPKKGKGGISAALSTQAPRVGLEPTTP